MTQQKNCCHHQCLIDSLWRGHYKAFIKINQNRGWNQMYSIHQWVVQRWHSPTRYYTAEIIQDFFGCWILRCGWGGLHNRKGNFKEEALPSYQEALMVMHKIGKRCEQRGYQLV